MQASIGRTQHASGGVLGTHLTHDMSHHHTGNSRPSIERWPQALPMDVIAVALQKLEVAMSHGNKAEAMTVIERAFEQGEFEPVTAVSSVARLELHPRTIGILESSKVEKVGHLLEMTLEDVLAMKSIGRKGAIQIRLALRKVGMKLRQPRSHGVPKWAVDLKVGAA